MINLILIFLFSTPTFSSTALVIQRSTPKGAEQKTVLFEQDHLLVIRNSNVFENNNDNRLGQLKGIKSEVHIKIEERLKEISKALAAVEEILKKTTSRYDNIEQTENQHSDKIYLDKILVTNDSAYYLELKNIIASLETYQFNLTQGIQFSKDKKNMETIKNGVVTSSEKFIIPFFCNKPTLPAECSMRNYGILYLK